MTAHDPLGRGLARCSTIRGYLCGGKVNRGATASCDRGRIHGGEFTRANSRGRSHFMDGVTGWTAQRVDRFAGRAGEPASKPAVCGCCGVWRACGDVGIGEFSIRPPERGQFVRIVVGSGDRDDTFENAPFSRHLRLPRCCAGGYHCRFRSGATRQCALLRRSYELAENWPAKVAVDRVG